MRRSAKVPPTTDNNLTDYGNTPRNPAFGDAPLTVEVTFGVPKIAHINTVDSTAYVKIFLNMWWEDYRFVGKQPEDLPKNVWTPQPTLVNAMPGLETSDEPVVLNDPATGLLFYCILFEGTVANPMDLREFPFDTDNLELLFTTTSDSVQLNGKPRQQAKDFVFRPVNGHRGMLQVNPEWDGEIAEFKLDGYSVYSREKSTSTGDTYSYLTIDFWLRRKTKYYVIKFILPTWLVFLLTCASLLIDPVTDLADRLSMITTMFLTAVALMYVISESLPKTDFLTYVDAQVLITMMSILLFVIITCIGNQLQLENHRFLDMTSFFVIFGFYFLYNMKLFLPHLTTVLKGRASKPEKYTNNYRYFRNKSVYYPAQFDFAAEDYGQEDFVEG